MTGIIEAKVPYSITGHGAQGLMADFSWNPADPVAVKVRFHWGQTDAESTEWTFSRELLADGMQSFMLLGSGDVKIRSTSGRNFLIAIASPEGAAQVIMDRAPVMAFLESTERIVPTGSIEEAARMDVLFSNVVNKILEGPNG